MPRIPAVPRLSIIVPVGDDVSTFEDTLLSVLENEPAGSEVLVAHHGDYDDRFDLGDEVRFVTTDVPGSLGLVSEATQQARGRFVHVLASGLHATSDWADHALEQFERHDTAAVAPIIRGPESGIVAAGWRDCQQRLCQPIAAGTTNVDQVDACSVQGTYLQASFWRREVLGGVLAAFPTENWLEASYASGRMLNAADWCCTLAADSQIMMDQPVDLSESSTYSRGQRLWAIKKAVDPATPKVGWGKVITGMLRPFAVAETWGQVNGAKVLADTQSRLQIEHVPCSSDHGAVIRFRQRVPRGKTA